MKALRYVVLVAMLIATVGFAQQNPQPVWESLFEFGGYGAPSGLQLLPRNGVFVNGWSEDTTRGYATLAGFTSGGTREWFYQDTTFSGNSISFSGHLAVIPRDNTVVWFRGIRGSYDPSSMVILNMDGTERWRIPVNRLTFLGNHTDSTFVSVLAGNNPIVFFHRANGTTWHQFPLGGTLATGKIPITFRQSDGTTSVLELPLGTQSIESIVTPVAVGNTLYIGGQYPGGVNTSLSYLIARYDIATGQQIWIQRFVDVAKGQMAVDAETGEVYLFGTKVVNNEPGGVLKLVRAKIDPNGGIAWYRENPGVSNNNWASGITVVGSGASKQVVLAGAIQRGATHTIQTDARAWGVKPSNGDSLWSVTRGDGATCSFQGAIQSGDEFVLLEQIWVSAQIGIGYGKLLKFLAKPLSVRELPGLPELFSLAQNYPNPFNPSTVISFQLTIGGSVSLTVYNLLGQEVATLVNEKLSAGKYEATWDANGFPSGTYFYRLMSNGLVQTKKMVLLK
ncbi:MAG: T9SS type A sorting domain-containing protein [bacterium]|nr:T9SS type A sorting domain-containing protein [bacterium]